MNTKFRSLALGLGLLTASTGVALGEGTYVYGDGSTKDYMAGVPVPAPMPIPMNEAQWYLRLDIGGSFVGGVDVGVQGVGISPHEADEIPTSVFGEAGIGYRFNKNFRVDFTSSFHDSYALTEDPVQTYVALREVPGPEDSNLAGANTTLRNFYNVTRTDEVQMKQQSTNMVNFYYDIANESKFTPYVGAGVGITYVNTEHTTLESANCFQGQQDFPSGIPSGTVNTGCHSNDDIRTSFTSTTSVEESEWLFSGALMAGFSYDFNEYLAMDAGYRVVYMPGTISRTSPTVTGNVTTDWTDFLNHQFRTGLRLKIF